MGTLFEQVGDIAAQGGHVRKLIQLVVPHGPGQPAADLHRAQGSAETEDLFCKLIRGAC